MGFKRIKKARSASFGKNEEEAAKSSKSTWQFIVLFTLLPVALVGWYEIYSTFLERNRPVVEISNLPKGIGISDAKISINIADTESGLKDLVVSTKQGMVVKQLVNKKYDQVGRVNAEQVEITLGSGNDLSEGKVELLVSATDKSVWSNSYQASFSFNVDYTSPVIEVLTVDHKITPGGSAMAIYKVEEANEIFSGITIGEWFFPGFSASDLDPAFSAHKNVHFTLFPVPMDFDPTKHNVTIIARDQVGNDQNLPLLVDLEPSQYLQKDIAINDELITIKIRELLERYDQYTGELRDYSRLESSNSGRVKMFRLVNEDYRHFAEQTLEPIFKRPKSRKIWRGGFLRQAGSDVKVPFGALLNFEYRGIEAGQTVYPGAALSVPADSLVMAANNGRIIFADVLGVYGKTVILDHGFGLTSVYGNLAGFRGLEGTEMLAGEVVGELGDEGVSAPGTLHFEIRLHGMPVQPAQWWDDQWVAENITAKIARAKRRLGIAAGSGF